MDLHIDMRWLLLYLDRHVLIWLFIIHLFAISLVLNYFHILPLIQIQKVFLICILLFLLQKLVPLLPLLLHLKQILYSINIMLSCNFVYPVTSFIPEGVTLLVILNLSQLDLVVLFIYYSFGGVTAVVLIVRSLLLAQVFFILNWISNSRNISLYLWSNGQLLFNLYAFLY